MVRGLFALFHLLTAMNAAPVAFRSFDCATGVVQRSHGASLSRLRRSGCARLPPMPISPDLVQHLKLCTVAIALDLGPDYQPKILGTGFMISEDGHVLTNAHVTMSLMTPLQYWPTLQLSPRSCVIAYQFMPGKGMAEIKASIKLVMAVTGKNVVPGGIIYGGPPDLSVIKTSFTKTPCLKMTQKDLPPEGSEVYFCGFPLGEQMF